MAAAGLGLLSAAAINGLAIFPARAGGSVIVVKMLDMPASFAPATVTISPGDTVKWVNVGNSVHHASSDPSRAIKGEDVAYPAGARPFDSGFLRPGQSYSFTFTKPGVYRYICLAHETQGMMGQVVVR